MLVSKFCSRDLAQQAVCVWCPSACFRVFVQKFLKQSPASIFPSNLAKDDGKIMLRRKCVKINQKSTEKQILLVVKNPAKEMFIIQKISDQEILSIFPYKIQYCLFSLALRKALHVCGAYTVVGTV